MVRPGALSENPDTAAEAARLDAACRAKARAEIAAAEAAATPVGGVLGQGDVLADVLLLKGEPGPGDLKARKALAGEDGAAIGKALDALGVVKSRYGACTKCGGPRAAALKRLRLLVEAIDPRTVVLLDATAAEDFAEAFGAPALASGVPTPVLGRTVIAIDDFAASLDDEVAKRRAWAQLKALKSDG